MNYYDLFEINSNYKVFKASKRIFFSRLKIQNTKYKRSIFKNPHIRIVSNLRSILNSSSTFKVESTLKSCKKFQFQNNDHKIYSMILSILVF